MTTRLKTEVHWDSEQFQALAEALPQIVWTAKPDGGLDFTNGRWHTYSGLTSEDSNDWGWATCVHPEDLPIASETWLNCVQTGETYETEFRLRKSDSTYFHIRQWTRLRHDGRESHLQNVSAIEH
jgi:PAS domain S-box-containing protein